MTSDKQPSLAADAVVAAWRELREETRLNAKSKRLVGVYSDPKRDPRGHVVSVVFKSMADALNLMKSTGP